MNFAHEFTYIYALTDPDNDKIRYIGQSVTPETRFKQHLSEIPRDLNSFRISSGTYNLKMKWVGWLRLNDKKPSLVVLEKCLLEDAAEREKFWIRMLLSEGNHLFNAMHGYYTFCRRYRQKIQWIVDEYNEFSKLLLKTLDNC